MRKHLTPARVLLPLLAVCWIAFIFWNSAKPGSVSGETSRAIVTTLTGQPAPQEKNTLERLVRKAGHLGEYALLGLLFRLSLVAWRRENRLWQGGFLLLGTAVAAADELFQLTVPGRSGQASDVLLDAAGLVLGLWLGGRVLWALRQLQKKR